MALTWMAAGDQDREHHMEKKREKKSLDQEGSYASLNKDTQREEDRVQHVK